MIELEESGWYSGKNKTGLTRDHRLSISYGWKRDIPPKIIKHPANCQLMHYHENSQKGWRSSLNYKELLDRIKIWEKKYH